MAATSYRAYLPSSKGESTETVIPFTDFKPQAFGRQLRAATVDPAAIVSVGFTIADKKEGPFELEIESVKAVTETAEPTSAKRGETIVEVAASAGTFGTLLAAATAADLAETLSDEGPFTVFARTDEAFSRLPAGAVESLLKPENKEKLAGILRHHVIAGRVSLAEALDAGEETTLQGGTVRVRFADGRVLIGPATLIKADLPASNGIIHVIDQVLLQPDASAPPLTPSALIELAIERGVPLFNNGNPEACAAVYEVTCEALRVIPGAPEATRTDVAEALAEMRTAETDREKAWILRRALDRARAYRLEAE